MIWWSAAIVALGLASPVAGRCNASANATKIPGFHVTFTPEFVPNDYQLHGEILLDGDFSSNQTILMLPIELFSLPGTKDGGQNLVAFNKHGPLQLSNHEATGPYSQPHRVWTADRAAEGPVTVQFTHRPAPVNISALPGPHYDLRNGTGGLIGSMWAVTPAPSPLSSDLYNISLTWNITQNQAAAFTWKDGKGPHSYQAVSTLRQFLQTFFMVGDVKGYPSIPANTSFAMYWMDEPPFNVTEVGSYVSQLLDYSTKFWKDETQEPYRVFSRINDESALTPGGSALLRSFAFGYNREAGISADRIRSLLAHEMTHNWTPWRDGTTAEGSRYNEGSAEYWSLRLLWRAGFMTSDEYLHEMNQRAMDYYTNPAVNMSDEAAMEVAWTMRKAQRIPYGRGMLHLLNIDTQLRANDAGNLDDLAVPFAQICQRQEACGATEWFQLLSGRLGQAAVDEWNQVSTGSPLIKPLDGSLGPCFDVVQNGTNPTIWVWQVKEGFNISSRECLI